MVWADSAYYLISKRGRFCGIAWSKRRIKRFQLHDEERRQHANECCCAGNRAEPGAPNAGGERGRWRLKSYFEG